MNIADYLKPDTSSQLKSSSEIFSAYLKAKQEAALAQASRASVDQNGNFDQSKYRQAALLGGVPLADAMAGVKDQYEWQQRAAAEKAREDAMWRERTQVGVARDGTPLYANPGEVDTRQLAVDPRLAAVNATPQAIDAERARVLAANKQAAEAAMSAKVGAAVGAPPTAGVGTPEAGATSTERAIYGGSAGAQAQTQKAMPNFLDVTKMAPEEAKTLAFGLRAAGTYTDRDDIPGKNMQAAANQYFAPMWDKLAKSEPLPQNFVGENGIDYGKFATAHQAWEAEMAGFPATVQKTLADWKTGRQTFETSRLGNAQTRQGMAIAGTNFQQEQDPIQAARDEGYKGVYAGNVQKFQTLKGQINWLEKTSEGAQELIDEIRQTGGVDKLKLQTYLQNLEQAPIVADKVVDIAGKEHIANMFAAKKEVAQVIRGSNTFGELGKNLAKNEFATDDQERVLSALKNMVDHQIKHGATASDLESLRTRKPKTARDAIKTKITESIKNAADVPVAKRTVGMKARLGNGKIGTWNGKGWDL